MRTTVVPAAGVHFRVTWPVWECPRDQTFAIPALVHQAFDRCALRSVATHGPATGLTLRYLRGSLRMKQAELAEAVGLSTETVTAMEKGAQPIAPAVWSMVADLARKTLDARSTSGDLVQVSTPDRGSASARPTVDDDRELRHFILEVADAVDL